ncbi:MAG: TonB-dependent receptor [Balneolaceae bacterium]
MSLTIRIFHNKVLAFLLILFTTPLVVHAQIAPNDTLKVDLDEIRVEAAHSSITIGKAPLSVSTLNRSSFDMTARPAATLNELTFTLPGVWISNRENHALGERMTIRGMGWRSPFGVRGITVVMDDIPLTVADGQTIMNMVDPAMIQSLELLRGPSATYWGNSSGGVLYMRTRPPADSPALSFRSYVGSYNTMKHEVRWHDIINGVRLHAYGSYSESDGFRDHSASNLIRGGLAASFDLGNNSTLETRMAYAGMPNAQHPGSLSGEDAADSPSMAWPAFVNADAGKEFQQVMLSGNFLNSRESGLFSLSAHGIYRDLNNPLTFGYILVDRLAGGTRSTYDFNRLPINLQIGAELKWQRDERQQRNNDQGKPGTQLSTDQTDFVNNQALFVQSAFDMDDLTLNIGLRADRMEFSVEDFIENNSSSREFYSLNPSAGINYRMDNVRLFANMSTTFEAPTTTEFKNRPGGGTGFNPNLKPEKTVGLETGLRGNSNKLRMEYELALFNLNVRDLIIPFEELDGGPTLYRNEGKTHHYGVEVHIRMAPVSPITMDLMYTWIHATFKDGDFEGNHVPGVSPHRAAAMISFQAGNHGISSDVEWVGEYFADSDNTTVNNSYLIVNSRYSYSGITFDNWSIHPFISIENILNKRYNTSVSINAFGGRFFEPGSDRHFMAGFRLNFK